MSTDGKMLYQRFDKAKERKMTTWYSHMRECYSYSVPQRETFFEHTPGQKKNTRVYDSTAVIATPIYANRIQKALLSGQFTKLVAGTQVDEEQMINFMGEDLSLEEALEKITDIAFEYINRSNLSTRAHEAMIDLAVSTGVLTCDYDPKKDELVFDAVPLSFVYLEAGPKGSVDAVWREHKMKCRNVPLTWPGAKLSDEMLKKIEEQPDTEVELVEGMIYNHAEDSYKLCVLYADDKSLMYEEDYGISSPWITFRTTVIPGEVYGRGPIMRVLPDIKTLNSMSENSLKSAALSVAGVWTATDDGVFNPYTVRIAPGVIIPVSSNANENPTLRSLDVGGNLQFHEMEYNRRVDNVNRALFAKPIGDIDDPTKTATEMSMRMQLDLEDSGSEFKRLQVELPGGIFKRVIHLLSEEGIIPQIKIDGKNVDIKYMTAVSQQDDADEANILVKSLQMSLGAGIPPEVVMADLKIEDMPSFILDKLGGPSEMKRSTADKEKIKEAAMQAQQAQVPAG